MQLQGYYAERGSTASGLRSTIILSASQKQKALGFVHGISASGTHKSCVPEAQTPEWIFVIRVPT